MIKSQLIGTLVDVGVWMAMGLIVLFFLPKYYRRRVELGKERPELSVSIKKPCKWAGLVLIAVGMIKLLDLFLP